jgi:hypothetical protein
MIYKLNCSDIAGLINKNKYKTQLEVFERIAIDNNLIDKIDDSYEQEIIEYARPEIQRVLESNTIADLDDTIQTYEHIVKQRVLNDIQNEVVIPNITIPDKIREIVKTNLSAPEIKLFIDNDKTVNKICKQINTIRGTQLEEQSTDKYSTKIEKPITNRNTRCYVYSTDRYNLCGRIDGQINNDTIIETKTRRRIWKSPPEYDIIQLRCYMKLLNKPLGILNEQFPDNTSRSTRINWDQRIWESIDKEIVNALDKFEAEFL